MTTLHAIQMALGGFSAGYALATLVALWVMKT
jgi:hypothetical protein